MNETEEMAAAILEWDAARREWWIGDSPATRRVTTVVTDLLRYSAAYNALEKIAERLKAR